MANKAISELPQAQNVNNQDLFVLEQGGLAKKLTAETFITEQGIIDALAEALDGHGGISSVTLSSVSGRIRTYLITFSDGSATTFQVYDGTTIERIAKTSTAGLVDTYTVFMNDGTTTFFTVTNGADGTVSEAMLNDALKGKAPAITETTESSAIANFTDGADDMVMHNVVAEINPVQDLSNGDPSPSNICPITGWTGANVTRTGKNLLENAATTSTVNGTTFTVNADKTITVSGTPTSNAGKVIRSGLFWDGSVANAIISFDAIPAGTRVYCKRVASDGTTSYPTLTASGSTLTNGYKYYDLTLQAQTSFNGSPFTVGFQLELGSTATAYEPYQSTTLTVDWLTEAGTVYGGTIDVATGLLTVTEVLYQAKWKDGVSAFVLGNNTRKGFNSGFVANYPHYTRTPTSNIAPYKANYDEDSLHFYVNATNGNNTLIFLPNDTDGETDIQICYELKTPQTYQLTPQQIMTLLGTNNVWTDIANVSVTYPADTKMFIEKLTMPTEDDLIANQAITSGKYFMIGNSLYLALANIASGAQITIGTNAQRVSLADALNTINS